MDESAIFRVYLFYFNFAVVHVKGGLHCKFFVCEFHCDGFLVHFAALMKKPDLISGAGLVWEAHPIRCKK